MLKKPKGPSRDKNGKFKSGTGGLKQFNFSRKQMIAGIVLVAVTGGFLVYRSLAATALLATPGAGIGVQDCTAAGGTAVKESSGSKRNANVCELANGKTMAPIRFGDGKVKTTNVTQYLAETQKLTGGVKNMQVCYIMKIASGTSASVNMGGYVEGGTPSGGHAHPLKTGDYQEYCDPNLYASNTRVFMTVTSGTVRVGSISLKRTDGTPPVATCEGPNITKNLCVNDSSVPPRARNSTGPETTIADYSPIPCGSGNGECANFSAAFRTQCDFSHVGYNDPIVYPGVAGASHLHMFFGNTDTDQTLTDPMSRGNSSCEGGTLNRTAYWAPALIDTKSYNATTKKFDIVKPMTTNDSGAPNNGGFPMQVYYKTGHQGVLTSQINQWFPKGMKIIAGGNPSTPPTGPVDPNTSAQSSMKVYFDCISWGEAQSIVNGIQYRTEIPEDCPAGRYIQATVLFPQCGKQNPDGSPVTDSPDHRSHMSYAAGWPDKGCPAGFPIAYPQITEHFRWRVPQSGAKGLRFASDVFYDAVPGSPTPKPGWTFHADWSNGWDQTTSTKIINLCFKTGGSAGTDCQLNIFDRNSSGQYIRLK